ncbi:hypothetical protein E3E31_10565 [Thermococcus sp. M39]|uniref:hypothetical protein n=1 Tax=unclassified Thermococcus TaxID=2627626 RepID=UPI00143A0459|nr:MULTISPECIES: hypothetical protein [unclassified Thermococcus]NJE08956.1 hypothetical protein [Thermococcus sp. M39]NJE12770.1 hypothetical protein [Thermococcus sp. LS2]
MGYTIYYRMEFGERKRAIKVIKPILEELGFTVYEKDAEILIKPPTNSVEPMIIKEKEWLSVKTYKRQPWTGIYKLLLVSLSSFASVEAFDDEGWSLR